MVPKKDYDDYTRFINDIYVDEKKDFLNKTFQQTPMTSKSSVFDRNTILKDAPSREDPAANKSFLQLEPLTVNLKHIVNKGSNTMKNRASSNVSGNRRFNFNFENIDLKPRVLEGQSRDSSDFMNVS